MAETRKLAAILAADVAGYSKLAAADEDRTLARLRALRSDLFDPTIALHHGRVVKRTGDGLLIEFRSVVDAVRCAFEVHNGMIEPQRWPPAWDASRAGSLAFARSTRSACLLVGNRSPQ
jgi:adenylate cyclase